MAAETPAKRKADRDAEGEAPTKRAGGVVKTRLYASFDIEADGSNPSQHSMLSFGVVFFDGAGKEVGAYQRNLKPRADRTYEPRCITEFWMKNQAIWDFVMTDAVEPRVFVEELAERIAAIKLEHDITWVANPASYDWQWLVAAWEAFKPEGAPGIGYSAKCIGTLMTAYAQAFDISNEDAEEARIKKTFEAEGHVAHNPEHDARVQGHLFFYLAKKLRMKL